MKGKALMKNNPLIKSIAHCGCEAKVKFVDKKYIFTFESPQDAACFFHMVLSGKLKNVKVEKLAISEEKKGE